MTVKQLIKILSKITKKASVKIFDCTDIRVGISVNQDGQWVVTLTPEAPTLDGERSSLGSK